MRSVASNRNHVGWFTRVRRWLVRFFDQAWVDLAIGVLILVSVSLTLAELSLPEASDSLPTISQVNLAITRLFAVELTLRFVAESLHRPFVRRYFRSWWLDLVAVVPSLLLPIFEAFRLVRTFQLMRFLRVLRVARLYRATTNLLPYVIKRGAVHIALIAVALFASIAMGTALMLSFEDYSGGFGEAFWFSLYSLFAGEPVPGEPSTIGGRIASVAILLMGLLVFAALIGTVSAYVIERLQKEGLGMGKGETYEDHVILCGLGSVGFRVMEALKRMDQKVVVIDNDEESEFHDRARASRTPLIIEDVRRIGVLRQAGIGRAKAVIACTSDGLTNLEIALDARQERPDIRVVLRMFDERLAEKVAHGFNIQVALSSSALSGPAFAAAAIDRSVRGTLDVGDRLYIHSEFRIPADSDLAGMTVGEVKAVYAVHTLVIEYEDRPWVWAPEAAEPLPGDTVVSLVGPYDKVEALKQACGVTEDLVKAFAASEVNLVG